MILFRDTLSHGGTRVPGFLAGCPELQRMQTDDGDILSAGDPLLLAVPVGADWRSLGDGWQVTCAGDSDPERYLRRRIDIKRIAVTDHHGRSWCAPAVLDAKGMIELSLPWGKADGVRSRCPTPEQQRMLAAARSARDEITAERLNTVPIDIIAEWVHALLEAMYHLNGAVIDELGLMDDTLSTNVLLASSGFPKPADWAAHV